MNKPYLATQGYSSLFQRYIDAHATAKIAVTFMVGLAIVLLFFPPLIYLKNGIALTAVANESLSYRYFYSLRLLQGEASGIVLPQGQALTILQHGFNLLLTYVFHFPLTDTWNRMEIFGYLSLFSVSLLSSGILIWIGISKKIEWQIKILLTIVLISFCYASRSGLSAFATPDYSSFEAVLTMFAVCLFIYTRTMDAKNRPQFLMLFLGMFAAILVAMKVSLLFTAIFPLLGLLSNTKLKQQPLAKLLKLLMQFAFWFVVWVGLLLCLFYCFNFSSMFSAFSTWGQFLANPGSEPNFWQNLLGSLYGSADQSTGYGYAWVIVLASLAVQCFVFVIAVKTHQVQTRVITVVLIASSLLYLFFLYHRPAGTTLWELSLYLTASACIALILNPQLKKTIWSFSLLLMLTVCVSLMINFSAVLDINRFQLSSLAVHDIHTFASSQPKMVAVIPNNDNTTGTVEEGLMKGASDFPTWNITTGQKLLNQIALGLIFSRDGSLITRDAGIFWIGIPNQAAPSNVTDAISERELHHPSLCRRWRVETWRWRLREVIVCKGYGN